MRILGIGQLPWWGYKHSDFLRNAESFMKVVQGNPDLVFYCPNPHKAPWHIQTVVNGFTLNFWPHRLRANFEGEKSRDGLNAIHALIAEARASENNDLIEKG